MTTDGLRDASTPPKRDLAKRWHQAQADHKLPIERRGFSGGTGQMKVHDARMSELRRHGAIAQAVVKQPGQTKAGRRYREAWFDTLWEYGERSPFQTACEALRNGDLEAMERALDEDRTLTALADAAR